jgi:hypothetical protein
MDQSPSWETNRSWDSQEVSRILWNAKVHTSSTSARYLCPEPDQSSPPSWKSILTLSSHLRVGLPNKSLYAALPYRIRAKCLAHLILLYFITPIILGEKYSSFLSSLFSNILCYFVISKCYYWRSLNVFHQSWSAITVKEQLSAVSCRLPAVGIGFAFLLNWKTWRRKLPWLNFRYPYYLRILLGRSEVNAKTPQP